MSWRGRTGIPTLLHNDIKVHGPTDQGLRQGSRVLCTQELTLAARNLVFGTPPVDLWFVDPFTARGVPSNDNHQAQRHKSWLAGHKWAGHEIDSELNKISELNDCQCQQDLFHLACVPFASAAEPKA